MFQIRTTIKLYVINICFVLHESQTLWCVGGIRVESEFGPRVVHGWVEA